MKRKSINLQLIFYLALGSEAIYIILATIENLRNNIPLYLLCYGVVFVLYWTASVLFFDLKYNNRQSNNNKVREQHWTIPQIPWLNNFINYQKNKQRLSSREVLTIGIFFGVIFRITLLLTTPALSDDIYRYIWDGKVASHGINPYQYAPDADSLSFLQDDEIFPRINHKEISTIYPPASQIIFMSLYKLHPSVFTFRIAFILFDLLTAGILFLILNSLAINLNRMLIYLWNPLVIVEFSSSGHADIVGIFFMVFALWLLLKNRWYCSTFIIVLSFLSKFFTIMFLPIIAFIKKENKLSLFLLFIIFTAAFYLPFARVGEKLFTGLYAYASKWQFHASFFTVILSTVKALLPERLIVDFMIIPYGFSQDEATIATRGADLALNISKVLIALIFVSIFVYYWKKFREDIEREGNIWIFKSGLILLGTFLLINPTVHPWYLCWLVPFLAITPNRACVLLTGLIGLSYWILIDYTKSGVWQESNWVKWVEYSPFYLLLIYDWLTAKKEHLFKSSQAISISRQ